MTKTKKARKKATKSAKEEKRPARPRRKTVPCDAIIFDIDNVLVDTRNSYLDAIRWTVELYLTDGKIPLFSPGKNKDSKPTLLTEEDIDEFKLLGGYNDDWDCCYGLLIYLLSVDVDKRTMDDLCKAKNIKKFAASIKRRPLGVTGITRLLSRPSAIKIEKISRMFQEIYLGRDLFKAVEALSPIYWKKKGLIEKERLIFKQKTLEKLVNNGLELGIATGRPRFEALYALKEFGIDPYFTTMMTSDDIKHQEEKSKQSLRKPHPYSVVETAKKIGKKKNFLYVGDLPDDVHAANGAKEDIAIHSVAFPTYSVTRPEALAEIQKAQPDYMIKNPAELLQLVGIR